MARQGKKNQSRKSKSKKSRQSTFELHISDISSEGNGIGKYRKRLIHVPFTIPGEKVNVQISDDRKTYAYAQGVDLVEVSADRVKSRCQHFGHEGCANCQWQHMHYNAQLALKTDILLDTLYRVGNFNSDQIGLLDAIGAPDIWEYKTQMDFFPTLRDELGFWSTDLGHAIGIHECKISHPTLFRIFQELNLDIPNLTNLRIQVGSYDTAMVVIRTKDETIPELETTMPVSMNFLLNDNVPINLLGETHIVQRILDADFRVTAGTQFRSYPQQIDKLVEAVLEMLDLKEDDMVLDLYGGVGIFSAFMARYASHVTYVDSYPPAATDAEENLADFENVDIIEGTVEEVLQVLVEESEEKYYSAVVDPSRGGMSDDAMEALSELNLSRIVYVSQEPESFAKNAKVLVDKYGYKLKAVQPIDFDPQTARIQSVALFEK